MDFYLIDNEKLYALCVDIFKREGLDDTSAADVAEMLISADLRGVRSHGVIRVKKYLDRIRSGGAKKNANMQVVYETPVTAVLDADNGLGGVASAMAVRLARSKAEQYGFGMVSVKNSNHFGMAGHWALKLAKDDMIGFSGSNTSPGMPPPGAVKPGIGNNPFAIAYSGEKYKDICVDMASSVVAMGKVVDMVQRGQPVPFGWFLDKDGNDSNDLRQAAMVLPFAGHKGYGIAFVVETLASLLSGGALPQNMNNQMQGDKPELASQYFAAIKIDAFRPASDFRADVDSYIDFLKTLPVKEGTNIVKYPGEIELNNKKQITSDGVRLPETLVNELMAVAGGYEIPKEQYAFLTERRVSA
jgi:LDH2 family malate/lactate/ureidoglycolate dehydrogenase